MFVIRKLALDVSAYFENAQGSNPVPAMIQIKNAVNVSIHDGECNLQNNATCVDISESGPTQTSGISIVNLLNDVNTGGILVNNHITGKTIPLYGAPFYYFPGESSGTFQNPVFTVDGNLTVTGTVSKAAGSFRIDNPLDPSNKYLSHSFVESPDMMNVYDGIAVLDAKGFADVKLPEYFDALNRDFR